MLIGFFHISQIEDDKHERESKTESIRVDSGRYIRMDSDYKEA